MKTTELSTWRTESDASKQGIAAVVSIIVGIALAVGFRHFEGPGFSGSKAGFFLGLLVLGVGIGMLLFGGKHAVTVETRSKRIIVEKINRFRTSVKQVRFDEISEVHVGEMGDQEGGSIRYHVVLKLRTGNEIPLFLGFFEGAHSKSVMEARCRRLVECLHADS